MIDPHDDELRASFLELRDADAARAPEFRSLAHRSPMAPPPTISGFAWRRRLPLIMAAATALLVLGIAREIGRRGREERVAAVLTSGVTPPIVAWQSPTQGLLNISGRELLAPSPVLSSVLGARPYVPIQRKGD